MAHRINILIDDGVWAELKGVPRKERGQVINRALREWFQARRRVAAARRMDQLRDRMAPVSTDEIVGWVRSDRERSR